MAEHHYAVRVTWTGNTGAGTSGYRAYSRDHLVAAGGAPMIAGSSDPAFRGDPARWNPEQLLVASLAQCHMLWVLHLAAAAGITVTAYTDDAAGTMVEDASGAGRFAEVVLRPQVRVSSAAMAPGMADVHARAHALCFIARSVNFPVRHEPVVVVGGGPRR